MVGEQLDMFPAKKRRAPAKKRARPKQRSLWASTFVWSKPKPKSRRRKLRAAKKAPPPPTITAELIAYAAFVTFIFLLFI